MHFDDEQEEVEASDGPPSWGRQDVLGGGQTPLLLVEVKVKRMHAEIRRPQELLGRLPVN
jgi:hypothetical protein